MELMHNAQVALDVLRREGPASFVSKTVPMLVRKAKDVTYSLPVVDDRCFERSLAELRARQADEDGVEDVIRTTSRYGGRGVYRNIEASYNDDEIAEVLERVAEIDPETVVEIGCGRGGSMYVWSRALSPGTFASLDLGNHHPNKTRLFAEFSDETDFVFLRGNSQTREMRERLEAALDGDPIDFLFVDGDHTYEGVSRDFELYHDLVRDGGIVALHDIVPKDNPRMGVPQFWREVREEYPSEEIVRPPDSAAGGTGVLYF